MTPEYKRVRRSTADDLSAKVGDRLTPNMNYVYDGKRYYYDGRTWYREYRDKRPTLGGAIEWIAHNDSPADNDPVETLRGLVTVALVADLFGKDQTDIARRIWAIRNP